MIVFFHIYHTNHPLENGKHECLWVIPFFTKAGVKTIKIQNFAWNHQGKRKFRLEPLRQTQNETVHSGERGMRLFFHLYRTNHPLENCNNEVCIGRPLFFKKRWFKPQKFFSQEPLRKAQNDCVPPALENRNHEVSIVHPLSLRRTCYQSVFSSISHETR